MSRKTCAKRLDDAKVYVLECIAADHVHYSYKDLCNIISAYDSMLRIGDVVLFMDFLECNNLVGDDVHQRKNR